MRTTRRCRRRLDGAELYYEGGRSDAAGRTVGHVVASYRTEESSTADAMIKHRAGSVLYWGGVDQSFRDLDRV